MKSRRAASKHNKSSFKSMYTFNNYISGKATLKEFLPARCALVSDHQLLGQFNAFKSISLKTKKPVFAFLVSAIQEARGVWQLNLERSLGARRLYGRFPGAHNNQIKKASHFFPHFIASRRAPLLVSSLHQAKWRFRQDSKRISKTPVKTNWAEHRTFA